MLADFGASTLPAPSAGTPAPVPPPPTVPTDDGFPIPKPLDNPLAASCAAFFAAWARFHASSFSRFSRCFSVSPGGGAAAAVVVVDDGIGSAEVDVDVDGRCGGADGSPASGGGGGGVGS
jgi:hypothetical protein